VKRSLLAGLAVSAAAALLLTGCTGGAPTGTAATGDGKNVTYLIGQPDTPAQLKEIQAEMKRFEVDSGVKVKLDVVPNDQARTLVQTRLRSGKGPDVFGYDTGPGFAGVLAKAGLLYDLTEHEQEADWGIYDWAAKTVTFDGKFYGIPDQIEQVGLYYNKDLFAQYDLEPPTTMPLLEKAAKTFKANGIIPFAAGDKEGWEGGHWLSMALASQVGADEMASLIAGDSDWDSTGVKNALNTWASFQKAGYLPPSPNGITYDNSNALFYSGKAAMNPTGTWLIQTINEAAKQDVGFVNFPAPNGEAVATTGLGSGTFMSSSSKNTDAALKLMDFLVSEEHGQWELTQYRIPAFQVTGSDTSPSPLFQQVVDDTASYAANGQGTGANIDVSATDVFNQAMWNGMQAIAGGTKTPDQVAASLQAAAEKAK
jgi:raffinose/stachyose/melibiose transport system substrate-binding protein